jgi:hypothetical protein
MGRVFSSPKIPAEDDITTLRIAFARAASSTRRLPMTLTSESRTGWSIDRALPTLAARWNTTSQPPAADSATPGAETSPSTNATPGSRFSA